METLKKVLQTKSLLNKILFSLAIIILYRLLAQISIPIDNLAALKDIFNNNPLLNIFSTLTGGSAENFSIVLMGLSPYINASIIVQLLTVIIPKFEELSKEGDTGRQKLNSITRWLTFPLAFLQSYGMIALLNSQSPVPIINNISDPSVILPIMLTVTAGTVLLVWLGELITEYGIGNGVSLLILASIIATVPSSIAQSLMVATQDATQIPKVTGIILLTIIMIVATVLITEAYRKVKINYASKSKKGAESELPIKINQAGMIPIIFAVSVVTFPTIVAQLVQGSQRPILQMYSRIVNTYFTVNSPLYLAVLFALILGFTYFYVSITFDTNKVSENLQKRGAFIPGVRPGKDTASYLENISNRLNLFGGLFIASIAVLPMIIQALFGQSGASVPVLISGAGILIIVGVVIELRKQINAQLITVDYSKLIK
jgi:preprotein translocase subunit SecY